MTSRVVRPAGGPSTEALRHAHLPLDHPDGPIARDAGDRSMSRRLVRALALAAALLVVVPAVVSAHPLGNFTINHYAGIRVSRDTVLIDFVLDRAEIPTFQEIRSVDPNGDGTIDQVEAAALRGPECMAVAPLLDLRAGTAPLALGLEAAGLSFPPGAGGLPTMRLVCTFRAALPSPVTAATVVTFEDRSFPERIGWREITAVGDGTTIWPASPGVAVPPVATASGRLSAYPADLLATPLDMRSAAITISPGGPALPPPAVPDATPLVPIVASGSAPASAVGTTAGAAPAGEPGGAPAGVSTAVTAAVPGGVGSEISGLLEARDLTPLAFILSLFTAALLGAGHALTPGHGKTVMAAYLVGARGTSRHAVGLGLSVTVSHTLGILVLAGIVVTAGSALPPEAFTRWAPLASALLVLGIGGWLVVGQVRGRLARRSIANAIGQDTVGAHTHEGRHPNALGPTAHAHDPHALHDHAHEPDGHAHEHAPVDHAHAGDGHAHHGDAHGHDTSLDLRQAIPGEHAHGGARHSHLPADNAPITWRNLALLGLAGGIVPSTNALLLLLAAIASGRPAWGLVLVVAFGIGMAVILGGVGLALVHARGLAARSGSGRLGVQLGRLVAVAPVLGATTVLALGVWLTSQALAGSIVL
jgi:ABC-type nickel/cobalt efflux system permease component RcnA